MSVNYSIEMNNAHKDSASVRDKFHKGRPVVEVFSSMVKGEPIATHVDAKLADKAMDYIKGLGEKASAGDTSAMAELNALRVIEIQPILQEEIKLLGIFGSYQNMGWDETIYIETYKHTAQSVAQQAEGVDVTFPTIVKDRYPIAPVTISGGYSVNYRQLAVGDASKENEGMNEVRKMIMNKAVLYVAKTIVDKIQNAKGVKYFYENEGLVKEDVDALLTKIRRFGRPSVLGDYALLSEFTPWAGFNSTVSGIKGISDALINEINDNGFLARYNGAILSEIPNPYDLTQIDGDNFKPLFPAGVGFVVPQGGQTSAIQTFTQGGLTSFSGNDVVTGETMTRFDLAVAADVAKGREYEVGVIVDSKLGTL